MAVDQLGWSDAQWEMVNNAVTESFTKASVAGAFLPCYGPLPGSAESVKKEKLQTRVTVDDLKLNVEADETLKLFNLRVGVELTTEQVADDALSSALLAFRRAANTLAQTEDHIVFNGYGKDEAVEAAEEARLKVAELEATLAEAERLLAATQQGAADYQQKQAARDVAARAHAAAIDARDEADNLKERIIRETEGVAAVVASGHPKASKGLAEKKDKNKLAFNVANGAPLGEEGERIVSAVVQAIGELEDHSHPGPFACVLGRRLFEEAHRPVTRSMVLPADRITPMLNGPLLRSGRMLADHGIVVSLAAGAIDIVVATPPKAQFLQQTQKAKYLFRVYERFVLRIKDKGRPAVQVFTVFRV